jgi:adenine-specific DNA glycosylase
MNLSRFLSLKNKFYMIINSEQKHFKTNIAKVKSFWTKFVNKY